MPPAPAPTHAQTVAALRHFSALEQQLEKALVEPDLGKADLKSKVIDGMTTLVANRIISPAEAVSQLATFPQRPFDQKKWIENHVAQIDQARDAILDHHRQAFAGANEDEVAGGPQPSPDDHMATMAGLLSTHYPGQK